MDALKGEMEGAMELQRTRWETMRVSFLTMQEQFTDHKNMCEQVCARSRIPSCARRVAAGSYVSAA